jgi:probable HAF family extracellular repeat protein
MKPTLWSFLTMIGLCAILIVPLQLCAESDQDNGDGHHHYKLIDLGTFGGPQSTYYTFTDPRINNRGIASGSADTSMPNPYVGNDNPLFFSSNPFVQHSFRWERGVLKELDSLPSGGTSQSDWINAGGDIAGYAENGIVDPLGGFPEVHAVVWKGEEIIDLGTLPGGYESTAVAVNNQGQVVGFSANGMIAPAGTSFWINEIRAFLWQDGVMLDLGTLDGDPNSLGVAINDKGQVTAFSYSSVKQRGFIWEKGVKQDLGSLGGSFVQPVDINSQGQITGTATLAGDTSTHAFLWEHGKMTDLGTFGGAYGDPAWINDEGDVVGASTYLDGTQHGALWSNGAIKDIGVFAGDCYSFAWFVNSRRQVTGEAGRCDGSPSHAVLWENGSLVDLNTLVPSTSILHLTKALSINDRGEIAGNGVLPSGDQHALLLIPCD